MRAPSDEHTTFEMCIRDRLTAGDLASWRKNAPTDDELDEAVENLTGKRYYRERR